MNAETLLPYLLKKVRTTKSDASRHYLCPKCCKRTKLNRLGDGRRKCSICGTKFSVNKMSERNKLRQCSEILLCFCLGLTELRTRQLGHFDAETITTYFHHFSVLIEEAQVKSGSYSAHSSLTPHMQARNIINLMPPDFLAVWFKEREET